MLFTYAPKAKHSGFTLVELLVISPLIMLVVAIIVATMINMTGSALQTRERNNLVYGMQEGLNQIEADIRLSQRILNSTDTLEAGQGSNSNFTGTAPFTTGSSVLVLEQFSTSKNPHDPDRTLIFYNSPYTCSNNLHRLNPALHHKVIFFLDGNTLKRRTVVDFADNSVCNSSTNTPIPNPNSSGIWQRNSCKTTDKSRCFTLDTIVANNIDSVNFQYYSSASDSSPDTPSSNSTSVRTTLIGKKQVSGSDITHTATLRASRIK